MPGGKGNIKPSDGKKFTRENQPSTKSKVEGRKKSLLLTDIASKIVTGESKDALESLAKYLGVEVDSINIETAMHLKQMEKAVKDGDTRAYNAVMDRIKGKPMQQIEISDHQIRPIKLVRPNGDK